MKVQVYISYHGMGKALCHYLRCYHLAESTPREMEDLMIYPVCPVKESNFNIARCMDIASKSKCWIFHLGRMMNV
jgi:hypothetical protein